MQVFISYAWENDAYRTLVKSLAARLREDGIDARLDAWHLDGLTIPEFMSREVRHADKILVVCSPQYRQKVHAMEDGQRMTGTGWESMLVTSSIWANLSDRRKIIPVLLRGAWNEAAPDVLIGLRYFDLSNMANFEANYRELLRSLTGQNEPAPPLGQPPEFVREPVEPLRGKQPQGALGPRHEVERLNDASVVQPDSESKPISKYSLRVLGSIIGVAATTLQRRYLAWIILIVLCSVLVVVSLLNVNFFVTNHNGDWRAILERWQLTVLMAQIPVATNSKTGGGFYSQVHDLLSGADPLLAAQSVMAVLTYARVSKPNKPLSSDVAAAVRDAFKFIDRVRVHDPASVGCGKGGWRGWSFLEPKLTVTEIAAWVILARIRALEVDSIWDAPERDLQRKEILCDLDEVSRRQSENGGWSPISYPADGNDRTYATVLALWSISEALRKSQLVHLTVEREKLRTALNKGATWLLNNCELGTWEPYPANHEANLYPGLTAQVFYVLNRASLVSKVLQIDQRYLKDREKFLDKSPDERSINYRDVIPAEDNEFEWPDDKHLVSMETMQLLWFPWSVLAYRVLSLDTTLPTNYQDLAKHRLQWLLTHYSDASGQIEYDHVDTFVLSENVFCESQIFERDDLVIND
jgi:hypothetical protein